MRYPMQAHKKELANAGEARERERELAQVSLSSLSVLSDCTHGDEIEQDILDGRADDDDDDLL